MIGRILKNFKMKYQRKTRILIVSLELTKKESHEI